MSGYIELQKKYSYNREVKIHATRIMYDHTERNNNYVHELLLS